MIFVVAPIFLSLRTLRNRIVWIGETENTKDTENLVLWAALMRMLHLAVLYFYYGLLWWLVTQRPVGCR